LTEIHLRFEIPILTLIPMTRSRYNKPCDAPVPKTCLMYGAPGANPSGVFGPCSSSVPPGPPPPPYDQAHRPVYHLTPASGHNNDVRCRSHLSPPAPLT
jgi:hypothetical protein